MANPTYATRRYVIAPGDSVQVARAADFVTALEASAPFKVSFDNQPRTDFEAGLTYDTESGFQRLEIINEGTDQLTVKLGFGRGEIKDSRLTISGGIETTALAPDTFTTGAPVSALDGAATLLAGSNIDRAEIIVTNTGADQVYIGGDAAAAAGEGLPLAGGQGLTLTTTAAIYARNDTGAAVAVAVAEIERGV